MTERPSPDRPATCRTAPDRDVRADDVPARHGQDGDGVSEPTATASSRGPDRLLRPFDALLFDMDGTILTSIAATARVWRRWMESHDLDADALLPKIHGMQTIESVRRFAPAGVDHAAEAAKITAMELEDTDGIAPIPGVAAFLAGLPEDRWAVVTSAGRALAERRIAAAGLPLPPVLLTAEDTPNSKPAPDGFVLGARRLGADPARCLVFEDSPAGIAAGEAAGSAVVVITATHAAPMATPHHQMPDYRGITRRDDGTGPIVLDFEA
ncbi:HAD family hydrolase [Stappia sp. 22II-S9-Z10]|nr:HAD family hydrolase [Stappia sp. 22II-S9-Z10]